MYMSLMIMETLTIRVAWHSNLPVFSVLKVLRLLKNEVSATRQSFSISSEEHCILGNLSQKYFLKVCFKFYFRDILKETLLSPVQKKKLSYLCWRLTIKYGIYKNKGGSEICVAVAHYLLKFQHQLKACRKSHEYDSSLNAWTISLTVQHFTFSFWSLNDTVWFLLNVIY